MMANGVNNEESKKCITTMSPSYGKGKIIRDLVHGYIEVDEIARDIIDTENFQRLKDIKQLTAQYVFPSANHSRFEHSLGVMHLAEQAFTYLARHLEGVGVEKDRIDSLGKNLKIAALLHDVGHAPFSHLGEKYFPHPPERIKEEIKSLLDRKNFKLDPAAFSEGSRHELMSCYVIFDNYLELLSSKGYNLDLICRCITGSNYNVIEKWPENLVIGLLNSKTIDCDKLDYLMRDVLMTGVNVSGIDTIRLFKNIYIYSPTKKITFHHRALPVIQNIIEARDAMYLWVYNHHITVYTDFLLEYYIKHLILNEENYNTHKNGRYVDRLDPNEFFSCEAISKRLVSDSDLWYQLKKPLRINMENVSSYTKVIAPQIFKRRFLKPLWKTIYEFKAFIENNIKDASHRREVIEKIGDESDPRWRAWVVKEVQKYCNLKLGEIFIIPRSNKFYSLSPETIFTVYVNDTNEDIASLLPQKNYSELYNKVSFYVFCPEHKKKEVEQKLKNLFNGPFPSKEDLEGISSTPKWLSY